MKKETVPLTPDEHGSVRVGKTRVTLDSIAYAFLDGSTPESIAEQYPSVSLADIYLVLGFYLKNRDEVEAYLTERRQQAGELRRQSEQIFDPIGIRERLQARQRRTKSA